MAKRWMLVALLIALSFVAGPARAAPFETKAKQAFMIDATSGTILFSKNADDLIPPASLAKLMTMETVFYALKEGKVSLNQEYTVSEHAWRTGGAPSGGSTMFAKLKSSIRMEDLIRGVIIQSANDGAIIIAEGMTGSEEKFAAEMNRRASAIGLKKSIFKNPTGLPADGQVVTVRELAMLGMHIWRTYPEFYRIYAEPDFTWNKITQRNRNPLLAMKIGADGMKTGFTEASGYAIVGSAESGGTRVFLAMSGMASDKERADEARKLLEWGMVGFSRTPLFSAEDTIGSVAVFGGDATSVPVRAKGPIAIPLPRNADEKLAARIVYQGPVVAPIKQGDQIGSLNVWLGDTLTQETPLYAAADVGAGSFHQRAWAAVRELAIGWLR
ncbi:MAG: D-alanyl-D-alanine carboxypeptidase family protein [Rhizobiaceae bacterium]